MKDQSNHVAAFFRNGEEAQRAIKDLYDQGFRSHEISCALGDDIDRSATKSDNERVHASFWQKIEDFFTGNEGYEEDRNTGVGDGSKLESPVVGRTLAVPSQYSSQLRQGRCLVVVDTTDVERRQRAEGILVAAGGEVEQSFQPEYNDASEYAANNSPHDEGVLSGKTAAQRDENQETGRDRIQLLSEQLRINKQRVQTGEVRLRKEVVTEQQNIQVPIEREELVIERVPVGDQVSTSELGTQREIRVPLTEEQVNVEKQQIVKEEVRVGKKTVQEQRNINDSVRHEELRVEKDSDTRLDEEVDPLRRKSA